MKELGERLTAVFAPDERRLFDGVVPLPLRGSTSIIHLGHLGLYFSVAYVDKGLWVEFNSPGLTDSAPTYILDHTMLLLVVAAGTTKKYLLEYVSADIVGAAPLTTLRAHLRVTELGVPPDGFAHRFFVGEILEDLSVIYTLHVGPPPLVLQATDFGTVPGVAPALGKCAQLVVKTGGASVGHVASVPWIQVGGTVITTTVRGDVSLKFVASPRLNAEDVMHLEVFIDRL